MIFFVGYWHWNDDNELGNKPAHAVPLASARQRPAPRKPNRKNGDYEFLERAFAVLKSRCLMMAPF